MLDPATGVAPGHDSAPRGPQPERAAVAFAATEALHRTQADGENPATVDVRTPQGVIHVTVHVEE